MPSIHGTFIQYALYLVNIIIQFLFFMQIRLLSLCFRLNIVVNFFIDIKTYPIMIPLYLKKGKNMTSTFYGGSPNISRRIDLHSFFVTILCIGYIFHRPWMV